MIYQFLGKRAWHKDLNPFIFIIFIFFNNCRIGQSKNSYQLSSIVSHPDSSKLCRTVLWNRIYYCTEQKFSIFTSFTCYIHLPPYIIPQEKKWFTNPRLYFHNCDMPVYRLENGTRVEAKLEEYNISDTNSLIYSSFDSEKDKQLWQKCYRAAMSCCEGMLRYSYLLEDSHCPYTWDGWQCFESRAPGDYAEVYCPDHIYFRSEPPPCSRKIRKYCRASGSFWEPHTDHPTGEWTNYSNCYDTDAMKLRHFVHISSYVVSLLALAPAIFIFFSYKQLHVPRITMHKNLFISIFINGIVFIFFKWFIILSELTSNEQEQSIVRENSIACKFLLLLTKYTRATTYMWMFCEGFYLHKLIVDAFAEQKNLLMYYVIGWGLPFVPVLVYSIVRLTYKHNDERCWTSPLGNFEWIFNGPNLLSLVVNLLFLCNIIRVLVTKLRAAQMNEPSQFRKAVRATLVLIPLFGLHFILTIYKPSSAPCEMIELHLYVNYLLDGLQGFLVSLIFCYLNGEVLYLLRRSYYRWKIKRSPRNRRLSRNLMGTQITSFTDSPCHRVGHSQATEMNCNHIHS